MKLLPIKKENHIPKYFYIDAEGKTLGRLANQIATLLTGTTTSLIYPGIDLGNYVIVINIEKLILSGKKIFTKKYYKNSQRPGSLKSITFFELLKKKAEMPLKKAVMGMLPKNKLQKKYLNRLFIYSSNDIINSKNLFSISNLKTFWVF